MLFDAGLAGICVPTEYGGQGLTPAHQQVLNEELRRLRVPDAVPGPDVLAVRGGAARLRHRGAEAAPHPRHPQGRGALDAVPLRAQRRLRRGRRAHHRGARRRRVGAQRLEGLDHRRLVVRLGPVPGPHQLGRPQAPRPHACSCFPIHQRGIEVHRIEMLNGSKEFCQEFLTDVRVPDSRPDRRGRRRLDRRHPVDVPRADARTTRRSSPSPAGGVRARRRRQRSMLDVARDAGRLDDPRGPRPHRRGRACSTWSATQLRRRVGHGHRAPAPCPTSPSAIGRLFGGHGRQPAHAPSPSSSPARPAAAWADDDGDARPSAASTSSCARSACIGGGTTEMARNVVSERVLGMPRERSGRPGRRRSATSPAAPRQPESPERGFRRQDRPETGTICRKNAPATPHAFRRRSSRNRRDLPQTCRRTSPGPAAPHPFRRRDRPGPARSAARTRAGRHLTARSARRPSRRRRRRGPCSRW